MSSCLTITKKIGIGNGLYSNAILSAYDDTD